MQSLVQNTFPYSTTVIVPAGSSTNSQNVAVSTASSFSQLFGNSNAQNFRVSNATLSLTGDSAHSLGIFQSIKVYLSGNSGNEVLVASRSDIGDNIGANLTLDIANTGSLDTMVKSGGFENENRLCTEAESVSRPITSNGS